MVGTGDRRNALAKRSSLCTKAISALWRSSRSAKVNNMQGSALTSRGCPATIDVVLRVFGQAQAGLHLRDGFPRFEALDRELASLGSFEHVHLVDRAPEYVLAG